MEGLWPDHDPKDRTTVAFYSATPELLQLLQLLIYLARIVLIFSAASLSAVSAVACPVRAR
jgi:hypothetical protein